MQTSVDPTPEFPQPAPLQQHEKTNKTFSMQRVVVAMSRGIRGASQISKCGAKYGSSGIRGYSTDLPINRSELGVFDAILMAKSPIRTLKTIKKDTKRCLTKALKGDKLLVNTVNDNLFVGNQRGLDIASLAHHLDTELAVRDLRIAELDKQIKIQQSEFGLASNRHEEQIKIQRGQFDLALNRHKECLQYLLPSDKSYQAVRDGYLGVYKHDYMKTDTLTDRNIIVERNSTLHWGDARADAVRYIKPASPMDSKPAGTGNSQGGSRTDPRPAGTTDPKPASTTDPKPAGTTDPKPPGTTDLKPAGTPTSSYQAEPTSS
ncbi:hypothetical protein B9Z19DRAFT_1134096 [Tuber borchii]|uniref:Uncharacterized protein n=1 Tax=Tuber borchii TaxID=42251 RepID=A0A2T6ZEP7_TUBBO|nr:hypothetical protein B9Z19DRAFT_1134096 [Tuber borchii]